MKKIVSEGKHILKKCNYGCSLPMKELDKSFRSNSYLKEPILSSSSWPAVVWLCVDVCFLWLTETSGRSWYHVLAVRRPSSWAVPRHGSHPVQHDGGGSRSVSPQDCDGKSDFPGPPGVRHPFLDVFYPASNHRQVKGS